MPWRVSCRVAAPWRSRRLDPAISVYSHSGFAIAGSCPLSTSGSGISDGNNRCRPMGIGSIVLQLRSGSVRIVAAPKLVVERGIAVAEQDDEGPDAQGGSEGELQHVEKGGYDGHHAAPLGALHQTPSGHQSQSGSDYEDPPAKLHDRGSQPLGGQRSVCPGPIHPGTEMPEHERLRSEER